VISHDDVRRLARLARLEVTDDEVELFAGQLEVILGAVQRVAEVAADDIPPTSHAVALTNVFRPDVRVPSLPLEAVLAGAPRSRTTSSGCPASSGTKSERAHPPQPPLSWPPP
jgi:aspartyl-tRNA(Asn)/glutamyl-tRNA(Gln) amidotransferase subunit C